MTATHPELIVELATARQVPAIAALHMASLPESMISMLGAAAVTRYYDLVTSSSMEHVFVARAEMINRQGAEDASGEERSKNGFSGSTDADWRLRRLGGSSSAVSAACVLTCEPRTVLRRFVGTSPLRFAADFARRSLSAPFRKRLLARVREGGAGGGPAVPEVTQIFTDAAQRGRGLGSALLRACEDKLRALGHLTYCIHTLRDDNDAGIRFYRREGFMDSGSSRSFGDHYLVMTKGLT